MRSEKSSNIYLPIIFTFLICLQGLPIYSQTDSALIFHDEILKATSLEQAFQTSENLHGFVNKQNGQQFLTDAEKILSAAAKSNYAKEIYFRLFTYFEELAKKKDLEPEFTLFAIKLEHNPDFSNDDVKNQLYYYYTLLYYRLKEYYYAEKYGTLFTSKGKKSFPPEIQSNCDLNAMTILAFIDRSKNNFTGAIAKLNITLDSSIAKKNNAWIGLTKGNIGHVYYLMGNNSEAIKYLNEDVRQSIIYESGSAMNAYILLMNIYLKQNQPEIAYKYLDSAHRILKDYLTKDSAIIRNYLKEAFEIHTTLGTKYFNQHDFVNAGFFYHEAFKLNELQIQEDKANQIKKIIEGVEIDRHQNQINELKEEINSKKETLFYYLIISIAFIGILIVYIFFYRHLRHVNKSLIEKTEIIEKQNIALEKTNNDKNRLFSIIGHDLRGPSNNLHQIIKAVADKRLPISVMEEQLPNVLKNSTNLVNTLESLLTWSQSQLNGIEVKKELIDVNIAVDKNIHFFEDLALQKEIKLVNNCHSKMVSIDKNHLEIILRNFTSNAIKFSNRNSIISFNQIDHGDQVEISVTDQGIGISDEKIHGIMNSTALKSLVGTSGEKGIGLGLLLTKEFIEINGGVLKIKSQLNEGTTMSFTIPKVG